MKSFINTTALLLIGISIGYLCGKHIGQEKSVSRLVADRTFKQSISNPYEIVLPTVIIKSKKSL